MQRDPQPHEREEAGSMVLIANETDIVSARQQGRQMAAEMGFTTTDQALIATAISELARNIIRYAGKGEVHLRRLFPRGLAAIEVIASDRGPGIKNLDEAMLDGFTTSGGLGLGLPGSKRLMDEFEVATGVDGTTIRALKFIGLVA